MRLNRFVATSLGISRRRADELIKKGQVKINSSVAEIGRIVKTDDVIEHNGRQLRITAPKTYIKLHKPTGYICSRRGQGSKTIYELLPTGLQSLKYIGRLDKDSSGLLILTNDGDYIYKLTHPKYQKTKVYLIELGTPLSAKDIIIIKTGVKLSDGISKFEISIKKDQIMVRLQEGRNRQIRRTFEALGYQVIKLHRIKFGPYELGSLKIGEWVKVKKLGV
jgi:23S rRNA pseudouridine2605 synthase